MYCILHRISLRALYPLQYCHFSDNWSTQGAYNNRLLGPTIDIYLPDGSCRPYEGKQIHVLIVH